MTRIQVTMKVVLKWKSVGDILRSTAPIISIGAAIRLGLLLDMKSHKNRLRISIAITVSVVVCVAIGYFSGIFFSLGIAICSPPPGIMVDGMATADVFTWHDLNSNGIQEAGEPPFPWVTVGFVSDHSPSITNDNGWGQVGAFKPGCACDCWEHESISVIIPQKYNATTATQVELTGQTEPYHFGFVAKENKQPITFQGEPDWYQAFINRGLNLTTFNYAVSTRQLTVSFDMETEQDPRETYREIFEIINQLHDLNIIIQQLELTISSLDHTVVCQWETIRRQMGIISPSEIIEYHCAHD